MTGTIIALATRERRIEDLRLAVSIALEAWRETRPGTAARRFWEAELIEVSQRLSLAEGMPARA